MVCTSDVPDVVNKLKPASSDPFFSCSPGLGSYPSTPSSSQLLPPGLLPGGGEGLQACPACSPPCGEFTGLDSRAFSICGVTGSLTNGTELGSPNPAGEARSEFLIKDGLGTMPGVERWWKPGNPVEKKEEPWPDFQVRKPGKFICKLGRGPRKLLGRGGSEPVILTW